MHTCVFWNTLIRVRSFIIFNCTVYNLNNVSVQNPFFITILIFTLVADKTREIRVRVPWKTLKHAMLNIYTEHSKALQRWEKRSLSIQKCGRACVFIFIGNSEIKSLRRPFLTGAGGDEKHLINFLRPYMKTSFMCNTW